MVWWCGWLSPGEIKDDPIRLKIATSTNLIRYPVAPRRGVTVTSRNLLL